MRVKCMAKVSANGLPIPRDTAAVGLCVPSRRKDSVAAYGPWRRENVRQVEHAHAIAEAAYPSSSLA